VEILKKFEMTDCKPMATPMVMNLKKLSETSSDSGDIDPHLRNKGSSLGNIVKGCLVFPLFEKGFPMITYCVLCMVILLVILVTAAIVLLHYLWLKFMLN
jgi:hypothetical protein